MRGLNALNNKRTRLNIVYAILCKGVGSRGNSNSEICNSALTGLKIIYQLVYLQL
jgi:hypothetical protein